MAPCKGSFTRLTSVGGANGAIDGLGVTAIGDSVRFAVDGAGVDTLEAFTGLCRRAKNHKRVL